MKLINLILGLVVIFLGILPWLVNTSFGVALKFIPSSGNMYYGLIVIAGVIIVVLNWKSDSRLERRLKGLR